MKSMMKKIMKKSMKKKMAAGLLLAGILGLGAGLSGCGASDSYSGSADSVAADASYDYGGLKSSENVLTEEAYEYEEAEDDAMEDATEEAGALDEAAAAGKSQSQKLIYTYNYSVETKEFDAFIQTISDRVNALGGYVEQSETNGNSVYGDRYASMTLRIPADKMQEMLSLVSKESNVTYSRQSSENVTLQYVDMQSHVKALRTEQEALLGLLEKATKVSDIISLQSQLTEVRYEIESYESQLRTYDNLVDYSTLYLEITEVIRTTSITDTRTTFGEEVKVRFGDNLYAVGQGLRSFAIWFIGSLPVIILLAVCAGVIAFVIIKINRRTKKKTKKFSSEKDLEQKEDSHEEDSQL